MSRTPRPVPARLGRRPAAAGRRAAPVGVRSRVPARRRHLRDAARPRRPPDRAGRAPRPPRAGPRPGWRSRSPTTSSAIADGRDRRRCSPPTGSADPTGDASVRITVSVARSAVAASCRRTRRRRRRSSSRPGRSRRRRPSTSSAACTSSRRPSGATRRARWPTLKTTSRADYVYARLEARRAGADDALFLTIDDHLSEATSANMFLVRRRADGVAELATPSLDCAILAGHDPVVAARLGRAGRPAAGRGPT